MSDPSVSMEALSAAELKAETQRLISKMQWSCWRLWFSSWYSSLKSSCVILGWSLVLLTVVSVTVGVVYGPDIGAAAIRVSFLMFALILYGLVKLPKSGRLVADLKRLSVGFKDISVTLKGRVKAEVWFQSLSSRWQSVQELENAAVEICGFVETMGSVVNTFLISELSKRLKQSQKHLQNI